MPDDRCQQESKGVSLLQQSAEQPAKPRRDPLHTSDAPTPHSPPMPTPNNAAEHAKGAEVMRESREHLDGGIKNQVHDHRHPPAEAIGEQSENQRPTAERPA